MSDCLRTDGVYRTACAELPYTANETVEHCENAKEGKDPVKSPPVLPTSGTFHNA
jgi:hypothetical protein